MSATSRWTAGGPRALVLLGCVVFLTAWRIGPPLTFLEEEGAIARAVETLRAKGGFERVLSIDIVDGQVSIEAQDPNSVRHVNRWTLTKHNIRSLHWEETDGPDPVPLVNTDLESNLFDIKQVDFAAAEGLIKEALARAAFEDPARVDRMRVERQLFLLPKTSSGDVRWSVSVRSDRESARVFADAKGRVTGLDLTYTDRGRTFNLLTSLDRLPEAASAFAEAVGTEPVLVEAEITLRGVWFKTTLEDKNPDFVGLKQRQTFSWGISGLARGSGTTDTSSFFWEDAPFAVTEADWSMAPALVQKARDALDMPDAAVDDIELTKFKDHPGAPRLEWKITLLKHGEKGVARFDAKGEQLGLTLPESRRKPFDGRDPAAWPAVLSQIEASFGGKGVLAELVIHDRHISIAAEDPQDPKELNQFLLDENGIRRFGTASLFEMQNPRFSASDLKALDEAQMRKLQETTAQRLGLTVAHITTISIGKSSLDPSSQDNVTVEIRAEEAPFKRSGRVNWEIDGREIKAYLP